MHNLYNVQVICRRLGLVILPQCHICNHKLHFQLTFRAGNASDRHCTKSSFSRNKHLKTNIKNTKERSEEYTCQYLNRATRSNTTIVLWEASGTSSSAYSRVEANKNTHTHSTITLSPPKYLLPLMDLHHVLFYY